MNKTHFADGISCNLMYYNLYFYIQKTLKSNKTVSLFSVLKKNVIKHNIFSTSFYVALSKILVLLKQSLLMRTKLLEEIKKKRKVSIVFKETNILGLERIWMK